MCFYFFDTSIKPEDLFFINDSKKLSRKKRIFATKKIRELRTRKKISFGLGIASVDEIDKYNILEATKISMIRAINNLNLTSYQLIIDGNIDLNLKNISIKNFIKGDNKSFSIAAASIIAKTYRDRYMQFLSHRFQNIIGLKILAMEQKNISNKYIKKDFLFIIEKVLNQ